MRGEQICVGTEPAAGEPVAFDQRLRPFQHVPAQIVVQLCDATGNRLKRACGDDQGGQKDQHNNYS